MPYDLDNDEKLDPMQVLEEAMRHFYRKAKIEESLGRFCDFRIVDKAIEKAARIGREIVSFRHPQWRFMRCTNPCPSLRRSGYGPDAAAMRRLRPHDGTAAESSL